MNRIRNFGLVFVMCLAVSAVLADSLELKNGSLVKGRFVGGDGNSINFQVGSSLQTYNVGDISKVRAAACNALGFLGVRLDNERNLRPSLDAEISAADSRVRVLVIRAEEDWAIATESWKLARVTALS